MWRQCCASSKGIIENSNLLCQPQINNSHWVIALLFGEDLPFKLVAVLCLLSAVALAESEQLNQLGDSELGYWLSQPQPEMLQLHYKAVGMNKQRLLI